VAELLARGRALDTSRPLVMGILNRTTDSFFDHGTYYAFDQFLAKAEELVVAGADLLDVGGVKAGPGEEVTLEMELERVVPAVEALVSRFDAVISVDTWRSEVLEAALGAGAHVEPAGEATVQTTQDRRRGRNRLSGQ
jgi:dihydropteroate synthase